MIKDVTHPLVCFCLNDFRQTDWILQLLYYEEMSLYAYIFKIQMRGCQLSLTLNEDHLKCNPMGYQFGGGESNWMVDVRFSTIVLCIIP